MRLVHRVSAAAPIGMVWALLADPSRWPEFDPFVRRVDGVTGRVRTGQHLLAIGRWLPLRVPVDVRAAEPQRRLALIVHTAPGLREEITSSLVETLHGGTEIRLASRPDGPLARLAAVPLWLRFALTARLLAWRAERATRRASRPAPRGVA